MTRSMDFARELQTVSAALQKAAVWNGSGLHVDASTQPYIFELMCFFRVALEVRSRFVLGIEGKTDGPPHRPKARWPQAPADKANYSYVSVRDANGSEVHQLCPGINVLDKFGKHRAPDISLLVGGTGAQPAFGDLQACWDAKHTETPTKRLSDVQVADFAVTFDSFMKPSAPQSWTDHVAAKCFRHSGLLTNGAQSTESDAFLAYHCIQETSIFPTAPVVRP